MVFTAIDIGALRDERAKRRGHHMLAHLRTELYRRVREPIYPGKLHQSSQAITFEENQRVTEAIKKERGYT